MRPSKFPDFATDPLYLDGDDLGLPTKVEPTAGEIAQGFFRGRKAPARKLNWQLGNIGEWVRYLDDQIDLAARATLIEPKGSVSGVNAVAKSIAWVPGLHSFVTLGGTSGLDFFNGANPAKLDNSTLPTMSGGHAGDDQIVSSDTDMIVVCRSSTSSGNNRVVRWTPVGGVGFTSPTGFPNGTGMPVAVLVGAQSVLVVDQGGASYQLGYASNFTARSNSGVSAPAFAASNGTVAVVASATGFANATVDGGQTWVASTLSSGFTALHSLIWHPRRERFYAYGVDGSGVRLVKFSDDGFSWVTASTTLVKPRNAPTMHIHSAMTAAAGGRMLVGARGAAGSGAYATTRILDYSFNGEDWFTFDLRTTGDIPIAMASGPGQTAVLYPSGVVRLFGAG